MNRTRVSYLTDILGLSTEICLSAKSLSNENWTAEDVPAYGADVWSQGVASSCRTLELSDRCVQALRDHEAEQMKTRLDTGQLLE